MQQAASGGYNYRYYLEVGGSTVGMILQSQTGALSTQYFHIDHLGSITAVTNDAGAVLQKFSYDAWGKRRNANGTDTTSAITSVVDRGYTGHEQLDSVALVNANGRIYDPALGRFMSVDPFIANPLYSQGFNRYSYVSNNPLTGTDPSGFLYRLHPGAPQPLLPPPGPSNSWDKFANQGQGDGGAKSGGSIIAIQTPDDSWIVCDPSGKSCGAAPSFEPPTAPDANSRAPAGDGTAILTPSPNALGNGSGASSSVIATLAQTETFGGLGQQVVNDIGDQTAATLTQQGQEESILESIVTSAKTARDYIEPASTINGWASISLAAAEYMGENLTFRGRLSKGEVSLLAHELGSAGAAAGIALDFANWQTGGMSGAHFLSNFAVTGVGVFGNVPGAVFAGGYFLTDTYYPHEEHKSGAAALLFDYFEMAPQIANEAQ